MTDRGGSRSRCRTLESRSPTSRSTDSTAPEPAPSGRRWLGFRARLTLGLIAVAISPCSFFGSLVLLDGGAGGDATSRAGCCSSRSRSASCSAVFVAYLLAADLTRPLRAIAAAVDRVSAGDLSTPIGVGGDDELARLAESHNRLAADLERRNRELGRILAAIEGASPRDGVEFLTGRAPADARSAFGLIDSRGDPRQPGRSRLEERIPGDPRPVRAELRVGNEQLGVLVGHLPATRRWERADQDLLELFASEIAVAIRNAQLFARSRPRTPSCSSSTPPRTSSCAASATTSRRR